MKSLFIYEELYYPYDEGMKKFSYKIYQNIENCMEVTAIRDIKWLPHAINSFMIVPRIIMTCIIKRPDVIVYIPKQSLTFFSLIKIFVINLFAGDKLRTIGLQKRKIGNFKTRLLKFLTFGKIYVLSHSMKEDLAKLNIQADVIYTGIDSDKFSPNSNKSQLRIKYNIPEDKTVILHVGHIKESRNLELLIDINNKHSNVQVVLIGSTATQQESDIQEKCLKAGIIVFNDNIDAIHELYSLSDIYCFPVKNDHAAMETPLSVLEAMSTNLPIITTKFGQLTELFSEDRHLRFINDIDDISETLITDILSTDCDNRNKVSNFTWEETTKTILAS